MRIFRIVAVCAIAGSLSGCFATTDLDRAAVGAAVGGVGAAAVGGSVATGVIGGAAVGALCDEVFRACR
ncbi:hypothetical protein [Nioella nitratireducens]|uniref:hypothetical protein n=1 Tax=Nioella nitratireducens TaxID=1287720 RepID=UPI0008FD6EC4|nr:hypothetical protein [Nioella nitratireducens]